MASIVKTNATESIAGKGLSRRNFVAAAAMGLAGLLLSFDVEAGSSFG